MSRSRTFYRYSVLLFVPTIPKNEGNPQCSVPVCEEIVEMVGIGEQVNDCHHLLCELFRRDGVDVLEGSDELLHLNRRGGWIGESWLV